MDTFDKREEGFERAFSHAEELRFRARARRNRRLGEWAGAQRGLTGAALEDHAAALSRRAVEDGDDEALVAELAESLGLSAHRVRRKVEEFEAEAMRALQAGR